MALKPRASLLEDSGKRQCEDWQLRHGKSLVYESQSVAEAYGTDTVMYLATNLCSSHVSLAHVAGNYHSRRADMSCRSVRHTHLLDDVL